MVALALRGTASVDDAATSGHAVGSDKAAREIQPVVVAGTLPADAFALEVVRDDSPAIGFLMAVVLSLPLWALLVGAAMYVVAAF